MIFGLSKNLPDFFKKASLSLLKTFLAQNKSLSVVLVIKNFLPTGHTDYDAGPWARFTNESGSVSVAPFRYCYTPQGCALEMNTDNEATNKNAFRCSGANACRLYLDSTNQRAKYTYVSSAGPETPFTRIVNFENISADEVKVTSKVYWRTGSMREAQEVKVVTHLFNVYGNP